MRKKRSRSKTNFQSPLILLIIIAVVGLVFYISYQVRTQTYNNRSLASEQTTPPYSFGTLMTDTAHAVEEKNAGVTTAMLEFGWDNYEPQDGVFSAANIEEQRRRLQTFQQAGLDVTLAFGTHYTPSWIYNYPNSRYINQYGVTANRPNVVFNQTVRIKMQEYIQHIIADLGINNFKRIRITSGGDAELMFPSMYDSQNHNNSYWAYDANSQNGGNLPPTIPRNPFPGWRPGNTTYNGQPITQAQVEQWYTWYLRALADSANWQIQLFKNAGYTGEFEILAPGQGTRPSQYTTSINNYLNGTGDPARTMGRGAVWHKLYEYLPDKQNVVAYVSSMADGSGNNDLCQPSDVNVSINDPQIMNWSATRWISYIADQYGLRKSGENPGRGDSNGYGVQMMNTTAQQMSACNFTGMYWAHSFNLYDGVSGVTLNDYRNIISQYNSVTPTPFPTFNPTTVVTPTLMPSIYVSPTPADTMPPSVTITAPLNGAVVGRNVNVAFNASAADNIAVASVRFYVNNVLRCTDTVAPYTCTFSTSGRPRTQYVLKVVANDAANNSNTRTITVYSSH